MRIVAGRWAGRTLTSPADARVRPTSETVRGALLDLLAPALRGARVLDLFAGTGALGLEALSRGAARADFVETRPASLHALRANIAALHVRERTRLFKRDAIPFSAGLPAGGYDIAFADPPYGSRMADLVIQAWLARPFARLLAVEHDAGQALPRGPAGTRRHGFGDTAVTIYRAELQAGVAVGQPQETAGPAPGPTTRPPQGAAPGPIPGDPAVARPPASGRTPVTGAAPAASARPAPRRAGRRGRGRGRRG